MVQTKCPFCGAERGPDTKFCTECGSRLGAPSIGRPLPQPPQEEEQEVVGAARLLQWFMEYFPGIFRPKVLVLSILALVVALGVGILALVMALLGAVIPAMFIGGSAMVIYWTAVSWLLLGDLCMPSEALAEFNGTHWLIFALLAAAPVVGTLIWFSTR
jgi:hypothetical protein